MVGMYNSAHQQHSQTLQSVAVVSVTDQERENEKTRQNSNENVHLDLASSARSELWNV